MSKVEWKTLGEVCERNNGMYITAAQMKELSSLKGDILIFAAGNTKVLVPRNVLPQDVIIEKESIIVKSRGYIDFEYCDIPFTHKRELWSYTSKDKTVQTKYLYYYLKSRTDYFQIAAKSNSVKLPQIGISSTDDYYVPIPTISVQRQIVSQLDTFTTLIAKLESELTLRQKQYEFYREELLRFEDDEEVEWKTLGELCAKVEKMQWKKESPLNLFQYIDLSSTEIGGNSITCTLEINSENAPSRALQIVKAGDILFGTTRPTLMRLVLVNADYDNQICSTGYCVIRITNKLTTNSFVYHILHTYKFLNYVDNNQEGASYPSISDTITKNYPIPIPSKHRQQQIVSQLDTFEQLIVALKREIALRRKQYDYYREKLLTFE